LVFIQLFFIKEDSRDSIILGRISDPGAFKAYKSYSFESGNTMRIAVKHASRRDTSRILFVKISAGNRGRFGPGPDKLFKEDL
jgi:hypothetical protein